MLQNYEKLLHAIEMIYGYNSNAETVDNLVIDDKNCIVEHLTLKQLQSRRIPSMEILSKDYTTSIANIEAGREQNEVVSRIDSLKKICTWFLVSKLFDNAMNADKTAFNFDDFFIETLGLGNNRTLIHQYQDTQIPSKSKLGLKKEFFTATDIKPLSVLLALYEKSLLPSVDSGVVKNIWFLCNRLDELCSQLLAENGTNVHQGEFVQYVDNAINDIRIIPNNIRHTSSELQTQVLMETITKKFVVYLQQLVDNDPTLSDVNKKSFQEMIATTEEVCNLLINYSQDSESTE